VLATPSGCDRRNTRMSVTYYVALPFLRTEDGVAAGQAQEMPSASAAIRRAELMSRDPFNAGALAFRRTGDPNSGDFGEPSILKSFGDVPNTPDET
jgi:hypothetical protein